MNSYIADLQLQPTGAGCALLQKISILRATNNSVYLLFIIFR